MKRIFAAICIASFLAFGVLYAGMAGAFGHVAHGSMAAALDCQAASCPATSGPAAPDPVACMAHCLNAAGIERAAAWPILANLLLLAAVLVAYSIPRPAAAGLADRGDFIGKFWLHQRLATVILRN